MMLQYSKLDMMQVAMLLGMKERNLTISLFRSVS